MGTIITRGYFFGKNGFPSNDKGEIEAPSLVDLHNKQQNDGES